MISSEKVSMFTEAANCTQFHIFELQFLSSNSKFSQICNFCKKTENTQNVPLQLSPEENRKKMFCENRGKRSTPQTKSITSSSSEEGTFVVEVLSLFRIGDSSLDEHMEFMGSTMLQQQ